MEECPSCDETFDSTRGMRIHHKLQHGESLATTELECKQCGETYEELKVRAGRSNFCSKECRYDWQGEQWEGDNNPRSAEDVILECVRCGEEYEVIPAREGKSRFCSRECLHAWMSENRSGENSHAWEGGEVELQCEECGSNFGVKPARIDEARFCSRECKNQWQEKNMTGGANPSWTGGLEEQTCEQCGETYRVKPAEAKMSRFCSQECLAEWQSENWRGEDAPAWKGGRYRYYGPSWQAQREAAIKRDGGKCVICGDPEVHVHHIIPFRRFGAENHKEANKLSNLICLCREHHAEWEGIPLRPDRR